LRTLIL